MNYVIQTVMYIEQMLDGCFVGEIAPDDVLLAADVRPRYGRTLRFERCSDGRAERAGRSRDEGAAPCEQWWIGGHAERR